MCCDGCAKGTEDARTAFSSGGGISSSWDII